VIGSKIVILFNEFGAAAPILIGTVSIPPPVGSASVTQWRVPDMILQSGG
jgi:hypothetical protein